MPDYKPFQKQLLKRVAEANKNKNNAALTPGRKRWLRLNTKKKRVMDYDKVKEAEKKAKANGWQSMAYKFSKPTKK